MSLVTMYGEMVPHTSRTIRAIPGSKEGGQGVYVLYDGSFPVYVGKGKIRQRLRAAHRSERRGRLWDHFSWFALGDMKNSHHIEALLQRMLPSYPRRLNRQRGKFKGAKKLG